MLRHFSLHGNLMSGVTLGSWARMLVENRFAIDPVHWPRAAAITAVAGLNSIFAGLESIDWALRPSDRPKVPPIFILGHWRNGTTHLHHLLTCDPALRFADNYQTLYPHSFRSDRVRYMREWVANRMGLVPAQRPMDRMPLGLSLPQEEELGMFLLTGHSPSGGLVFPRRHREYDRYLSFDGVSTRKTDRWKRVFVDYVEKLGSMGEGTLVLKSPPHTARISILLELFPGAKFVHIARDPARTFSSMMHLYETLGEHLRLQAFDRQATERFVIARYREMYNRYFFERPMIPDGDLVELRYEDLVRRPEPEVGRLCDELGIVRSREARSNLTTYLATIDGYEVNELRPAGRLIESELKSEWKACFEEWGYAK